MKTILKAVVGSHAYGLATPTSDTDYQGIYVLPTEEILGIRRYAETHSNTSGVDKVTSPDTTMHEVQKFMHLALDGNPTAMEVLWLPEYLELTLEGRLLTDIRQSFLSQRVRKKYGGYAKGQLAGYQTGKQARHLMRLVLQAQNILETGLLRVRLSEHEIFLCREAERRAEESLAAFKEYALGQIELVETIPSDLPMEPDMNAANDILITIRKLN